MIDKPKTPRPKGSGFIPSPPTRSTMASAIFKSQLATQRDLPVTIRRFSWEKK